MAGAEASESGRGNHAKIYAVPRPAAAAIDAELDDWDLSGKLRIFVIEETSEAQRADFALMYDAEAIYLGAVVREASPLMNRHDPRVDGHKGWDADSTQFRIILDPAQGFPVNQSSFEPVPNDQMAHLTLWYYTDRKEPCLQMHVGMGFEVPRPEWAPHGVVPRDLYEAAYALGEDGRGYSFEYRIPWATLGAKSPPKAGDLVSGTVQFNWSAPDGLTTAGGAAWAYDVMAGPGFPFQSSACWGKIIFSDRGNLPADLVEEEGPAEKPLPLVFEYELPEDGEATIQIFDAKGIAVRSIVAQAPRRAGRNVEKWDGLDDLGRPLAEGTYAWKGLYHQPLGHKFILSVHNSGQPPYKTDDNTGAWGGDHGIATAACAVPGGMLLAWNACESGWGIIRTDLEGRKRWGSRHSATHLATDGKRFFAAGDEGFDRAPGVKVFDLADGRPLNFGNGSPVLAPPEGGSARSNEVTGLAVHDGIVYVAFRRRDRIALYDGAEGTLRSMLEVPSPGHLAVRPDGSLAVAARFADHVDEPTGIAVAPDGTTFVANRGELQNVSVFGADGKYVRSIGAAGGRPRKGLYDPRGMLEPGGIAINGKGRLWVAETLDSPKRISVWDPRTGGLVAEYFGGSAYSTFVWMDPEHPDEVYCHNVLWKIDLARGSWRPHLTCWRGADPNACPVPYNEFRVITAKNGRQYGWGNVHAKGAVLFLRAGDVFEPVLMLFYNIDSHSLTPWPAFPLMSDIERYPNGRYAWVDANDDQILQHDEIARIEPEHGFFHWVDADLALWSGSGRVYRPIRVEGDGRPVYDFAKPEKVPVYGDNGHGPLVVDPIDGSLYTNAPGRDPGFARWTADGKLLWGYRGTIGWHDAVNLPPLRPGNLWGPTCPLGVAGEFTGIATYFGPIHIFTRDGLYAGMVFRDGRAGGLGPDVIACELFSGQLVKPKGMDRYFILVGDQDGRITEVLGLDTVKRLAGGTYTHTPEAAQKAAEAQREYAARAARAKRLEIVRGPAARGVGKRIDDARGFSVRAAYDEKNLYLTYEASSPYDLANEIEDPRLIFKGGNLIDLQLASDPRADPKRDTPAPGDVRVLITRQKGKPVAVVYRPKVAGFAGEPIVFTSPTGKESFDAIERSEAVGLEYAKTPAGFRAVAVVPLSLLGWTPRPGARVRMDVGYLFGNDRGTQVALRAYWANNGFAANVTNDVPHESRLTPKEWGEAVVE